MSGRDIAPALSSIVRRQEGRDLVRRRTEWVLRLLASARGTPGGSQWSSSRRLVHASPPNPVGPIVAASLLASKPVVPVGRLCAVIAWPSGLSGACRLRALRRSRGQGRRGAPLRRSSLKVGSFGNVILFAELSLRKPWRQNACVPVSKVSVCRLTSRSSERHSA